MIEIFSKYKYIKLVNVWISYIEVKKKKKEMGENDFEFFGFYF